jgi:RNA ligase
MITKDILEKYVADGWLISQVHPTLPLTIYNYSQATQYEAHWDEVTLHCRGLVVDDMGTIVARPFKKFFNIEENKHTATNEFEIYEKMDGSLGIMFYYKGEWVFASRGSFTSEQAIKGRELIDKYDLELLSPGYTYLFEIVYPENRIVVNYGDMEDVVLLGGIEITDGGEIDVHDEYYTSNFNVVKRYDFKDYNEIQKLNWENNEGFVVRFTNGDRCKIKFKDYVELHRVLTNCSSYYVWENLKTFGKLPEEMLKEVPDEFYNWVKGIENRLRREYDFVYNKHIARMSNILRDGLTRKEFALRVQELEGYNQGIIFAMYNGKGDMVKQLIWKMIKPAYEKPFAKS